MGLSIIAHSVLDELIIYLCAKEAEALIELCARESNFKDSEDYDDPIEWVFDMFDDEDIITFLYSNVYLSEDHPFRFFHWSEQCFYMDLDD